MTSTDIVVLRKTPYSESSLIIASLSPDFGRLDFLIRGARRLEKKKFPQVDLFRELNVHFREDKSGLHTLNSVELVRSHDGVALDIESFTGASRMASFVLRNSHPMIPGRRLYKSLTAMLARLSREKMHGSAVEFVKLVYLDEHGLLPKTLGDAADKKAEADRHKFLDKLLAALLEGAPLPQFSDNYWKAFSAWISELCAYHELAE